MKRLRIYAWPVAACVVMSTAVGFYLKYTYDISRVAELGVYFGGLVVGLIMGGVIDFTSGAAARCLVRVMTATGDVEQAPSFSYQESLAAKGKYDEAAIAYRAHLTEHPDDYHARIALADLYAAHLDDPSTAQQLYLEVRGSEPPPPPQLERIATESLIDLYSKTGQRGRLMAELARTADSYRGTPAGDAAKRALMDLKEEGKGGQGGQGE